MGWNRQDLTLSPYEPFELHMTAALGDEDETKLPQNADQLVAGQSTKLGHESDRSRR